MTNKSNAVLKQECHSPKSLWEIFRARSTSETRVAKGYEEDPRQQPSGLTTLLNFINPSPALRAPSPARGEGNKRSSFPARSVIPQACNAGYSRRAGFTLIELLVVVLIIAILAAIALPQYQKAVEKSKAAQAFSVLQSMSEAAYAYYLNTGNYPTSFSQLDLKIPWKGKKTWGELCVSDSISNEDWALEIYNGKACASKTIQIGRIKGPYAGAGFSIGMAPLHTSKISCAERTRYGILFKKKAGAYCVDIFKGTGGDGINVRGYTLP